VRTARPFPLPQRPVPLAELLAQPGVTRAVIRSRLASGSLLRLRDGVYLAASAWPADPVAQHVVRARAEQAANPSAVISHHSAALVWKLPSPPLAAWLDLPPTLTCHRAGGERSRRSTNGRVLVAGLAAHQITRDPEGWPVTSIARTAVDLALDLSLRDGLVVVDAAARLLCGELVAAPRRSDYANPVLAASARALLLDACEGRRRTAVAREVIRLADPRRESPIESLSAAAFHLAGLPMPQFQVPIRTRFGTLYPDCLWVEENLIGEADGGGKGEGRGAYEQEREREQVLRDLGYRVVRWLGKEITYRPEVVVARVARELGL